MVVGRRVAVAVLLAAVAVAHGDEHSEMSGMTMSNGTQGYDPGLDLPNYAGLQAHSSMMTAHIILMVLAWFFVLPFGVMFSIARSKIALPVQLSFLVLNGVGVALGIVFNVSTPDLYENNAHHSIGWVATWIMTAQAMMSLLFLYAGRTQKEEVSPRERVAFLPATLRDLDNSNNRQFSEYRWSADSGHSTVIGSPRNDSRDLSPSDPAREHFHKPEQDLEDDEEFPTVSTNKRTGLLRHNFLDKYLSTRVPNLFPRTLVKAMEIVYEVIDRTILILGFVALMSGGVTYVGIFRGIEVFSGLAHFVKGGIFFWYGLLCLGRWAGCFADFGWAWNVKPTRSEVGAQKSAVVTAEFSESFLIFLYGITNVFMEHLAGSGKPWSAQDLEHVSITIMFFGGGLLGMLIESKAIRRWLNTSVDMMPTRTEAHPAEAQEIRNVPKQYAHPMNPIPALIILLLGIMMSSHHQDSMVSTMVHKQWGTLLCGAALARSLTYIINYISPPTSIYPSRPPTELITSFCLISGGLIFMFSARNCVQLMEKYNVMAMFIFTVVMGFTAFVMAYEVLVLSLKGWLVRRENKSFRS